VRLYYHVHVFTHEDMATWFTLNLRYHKSQAVIRVDIALPEVWFRPPSKFYMNTAIMTETRTR
jgi:hypothetical protein